MATLAFIFFMVVCSVAVLFILLLHLGWIKRPVAIDDSVGKPYAVFVITDQGIVRSRWEIYEAAMAEYERACDDPATIFTCLLNTAASGSKRMDGYHANPLFFDWEKTHKAPEYF